MQPYLILGFMIVLGYLAHNLTVSYAAGLLVLMKLVLPEEKLMYFSSHGVNWGIILLMAALMVPIATADQNDHGANENLDLDCFIKGIKTGAALIDNMGKMKK